MTTASEAVTQQQPDRASCVGRAFDTLDYRDLFSVALPPGRFADVDAMARVFFSSQSRWFPLISMNTTPARMRRHLAATNFALGSRVGSWKVFDRSEDEIVFGDHMGFMEYRFSLSLRTAVLPEPGDVAQGSTAVRFVWRRTGRFYFELVKPFHRWFVRTTLQRLASDRDRALRGGQRPASRLPPDWAPASS